MCDLRQMMDEFDSVLVCGDQTQCFEVGIVLLVAQWKWTINTALRYTQGVTGFGQVAMTDRLV